jgi:hypothetical protein
VNFAIPAFEDPPVRTRVAQVASPLDQGVVRLQHLEGVGATVRDRHLRHRGEMGRGDGMMLSGERVVELRGEPFPDGRCRVMASAGSRATCQLLSLPGVFEIELKTTRQGRSIQADLYTGKSREWSRGRVFARPWDARKPRRSLIVVVPRDAPVRFSWHKRRGRYGERVQQGRGGSRERCRGQWERPKIWDSPRICNPASVGDKVEMLSECRVGNEVHLPAWMGRTIRGWLPGVLGALEPGGSSAGRDPWSAVCFFFPLSDEAARGTGPLLSQLCKCGTGGAQPVDCMRRLQAATERPRVWWCMGWVAV